MKNIYFNPIYPKYYHYNDNYYIVNIKLLIWYFILFFAYSVFEIQHTFKINSNINSDAKFSSGILDSVFKFHNVDSWKIATHAKCFKTYLKVFQ